MRFTFNDSQLLAKISTHHSHDGNRSQGLLLPSFDVHIFDEAGTNIAQFNKVAVLGLPSASNTLTLSLAVPTSFSKGSHSLEMKLRSDVVFEDSKSRIHVFDPLQHSWIQLDDTSAHVSGSAGLSDSANAGALSVKAPMSCKVTQILISEGQTVNKDEVLVVVEAMKMEHVIRAPAAGLVVSKLHCAVGDLANDGQLLVSLKPSTQEEEEQQQQP
ncbi:hypothetical protein EV182_006357 [Spiromyces aspiralis]|uniref:Uncharacterized protein n=1 Tax=Spiromyces aspiralis TaxID=68401 RepID=A0ACC1HTW7_9FUNG|nr:hypothetical protein EV182_006357 [Spiromyces aspiralis]